MNNWEGWMSQKCDLYIATPFFCSVRFQSFSVKGWQLFTAQSFDMKIVPSDVL